MRRLMQLALSASIVLLTFTHARASSEYESTRAEVEAKRQELRQSFQRARTQRAKDRVLDEGSQFLFRAITEELAPHWYGTRWDFAGLTSKPKQGAIACGTFVATLLEHAGFRLDRVQMGRLASEHIALSLTREAQLRRYRSRPVDEVVQDVVSWGPGLYMVGLDNHAALALVDEAGTPWLLHSSYVGTSEVVKEPLGGPNPFSASRYRVVARLLDREMVKGWLLGSRFEARSDHKRRG